MGKKPAARQGTPMWVAAADLPMSAGHPFFERLNRVLSEAGFDAFVEKLCLVRRVLRKHGYPPDRQESATRTVLEQAEALSAGQAA